VLIGSFFLTFEQGIGLLNFGALIAFMGVNASAFMRYFVRSFKELIGRPLGGIVWAVLVSLLLPRNAKKNAGNFLLPIIGFGVCGGLFVNLSGHALRLGFCWMIAGLAFGVWKTKWFRQPLSFEMPAE